MEVLKFVQHRDVGLWKEVTEEFFFSNPKHEVLWIQMFVAP